MCQPDATQSRGRSRLREHVRQRDAGRRAEPDHRAAEADGVGEEAPVVAALPERQRGERDVVEDGRDEAEAERRPATTPPAAPRPASSRPRARALSRKTLPLTRTGTHPPVGTRQRRPTAMSASQTARPMHRQAVEPGAEVEVGDDVRGQRRDEDGDDGDHAHRGRSRTPPGASLTIGWRACCCARREHAEDQQRRNRRRCRPRRPGSGRMPAIHIMVVVVSPTTLPEPPRVGGRDDGGEVADVQPAAEERGRHRAADHRGRDVVEEARQHEHQRSASRSRPSSRRAGSEAAGAGSGSPRNDGRGARSRRAGQQVGDEHPLDGEVMDEAGQPGLAMKGRERDLVDGDDRKPMTAMRRVCRWATAMPTRTAAKRRKSTGMPATTGTEFKRSASAGRAERHDGM